MSGWRSSEGLMQLYLQPVALIFNAPSNFDECGSRGVQTRRETLHVLPLWPTGLKYSSLLRVLVVVHVFPSVPSCVAALDNPALVGLWAGL